MSAEHEEKLIEEMIRKAKAEAGTDFSAWKKEKSISPLFAVIQGLVSIPTKTPKQPDYDRIKNQILDRINRSQETSESFWSTAFRALPKVLKLTSGAIASFIVIISLAIGTAAASLESLPGEPLYPLKTVVEKVQLRLASNDQERANLQIKFANTRLEELEKALEQNKQGKISGQEVQQIVSKTVRDLESTNTAITERPVNTSEKPATILNKLVDLNNKQSTILRSASIESEGEVKIELEKALAAAEVTKEKAIENIERAGLIVEETPVQIEETPINQVTATGNLTAVSPDSVNIGSTKFLVTKGTQFANITQAELKVGQTVDIIGTIENDLTLANKITLIPETSSEPGTDGQAPASENQQ